jgi:PleD family two-component response regulator
VLAGASAESDLPVVALDEAFESALARADNLMHGAKSAGRNQVHVAPA